MPTTSPLSNGTRKLLGAVAWCAISAIYRNVPAGTLGALVRNLQLQFNLTRDQMLPTLVSDDPSTTYGAVPVALTVDGVWGPKTAVAAIYMLAMAAGDAGSRSACGFPALAGASTNITGLTTLATVRTHYVAMRDTVTCISNRTSVPGAQGFAAMGEGAVDVALRAQNATQVLQLVTQYYSTLGTATPVTAPTAPTSAAVATTLPIQMDRITSPTAPTSVTINSTRTVSAPQIQAVLQAGQTPSSGPVALEVPESQPAGPASGGIQEFEPINITGERASSGPNLAIILPLGIVGVIGLVYLAKKWKRDSR